MLKPDTWIWALVVAATAGVVVLAVRQGDGSKARLAQAPGRTAPSVTLPLLEGGKSSISQGKVTVVDFWATWCAPCRASMPRVQQLWKEYHPRGVELYSVDTDDAGPDRVPQVQEFLLQNRLDFPVVLDDGSASQAFSVSSLPTMMLLDKQGQVVWSHVGALSASREKDLRLAMDQALR